MKIAPFWPSEISSVYGKYIHLIHRAKAVKMDIMIWPAVSKHKMAYNTVDRATT